MKKISNLLSRFPAIRQLGMECGSTAIAIICKYYGAPNLQIPLAHHIAMGQDGINLQKIIEVFGDLGFEAEAYQLTYDDLELMELPFIVHYNINHFIVVYEMGDTYVKASDPDKGLVRMKKTEFIDKWGKVAVNVIPREDALETKLANQLTELASEAKFPFHRFFQEAFVKSKNKTFKSGFL